jgi:paraquat-inducible protein A
LLATVVFIASIVVPLAKLITLSLLLILVQRRSTWRPLLRSRLYRMIDFIGRWSMLDIFVVALLVALVQIPSLAAITVGPGALAFGALVVTTMVASMSFDPRLIWDPIDDA